MTYLTAKTTAQFRERQENTKPYSGYEVLGQVHRTHRLPDGNGKVTNLRTREQPSSSERTKNNGRPAVRKPSLPRLSPVVVFAVFVVLVVEMARGAGSVQHASLVLWPNCAFRVGQQRRFALCLRARRGERWLWRW